MSTTQSDATAGSLTVPCPSCHKWNRIDAARATAGPKCGACGAAIPLDQPMHLDDTSFDRVIAASTLPVMVDFYADWCGPCKMMAPAVDQLARASAGTALVAKLDTEAAPRTAQRFNIRGIPTVIVFRGGREAKRQSGAMPFGALRAMLGD
ncbi:MAG: thioredoxin [Gemmatimonadetes bacterium]|jgi:thioredoxin 2|nr:thioredoxin [Gemmatimonadota bacterium]